MATSYKLEVSVKGGMSGIKQAMMQMKETIKETEGKATRVERERDQARTAYQRAYNKQKNMRDKMVELEEDLRKSEEKKKDVQRRLNEKELFLTEAAKFHSELIQSTPGEGEVETVAKQLKIMKTIYAKNFDRCQHARNKKIELEQRVEFAEIKAQDATRRLQSLNTELEYNQVEESRRTNGCKDAIDAAFKTEKDCLSLEKGLSIIMKRKEIATQKINTLEGKISKAENSIDTINFDRRRIEATVREILINVKKQNKQ